MRTLGHCDGVWAIVTRGGAQLEVNANSASFFMIDELVHDDGCKLRDLIAECFQVAREVRAYVVFNSLDDLSRSLVFLDKALDFVDGKAA